MTDPAMIPVIEGIERSAYALEADLRWQFKALREECARFVGPVRSSTEWTGGSVQFFVSSISGLWGEIRPGDVFCGPARLQGPSWFGFAQQ